MMHRAVMAGFVLMAWIAGAAATPPPVPGDALALHVLNRLAFGPDRGSLEDIRRLGVDAWIDRQLHPDTIPEPPGLTQFLSGLDTQGLDAVELFQDYRPLPQKQIAADPEAEKENRRRARLIGREAAEARLARAIYSPRQLQEVMVDFWFNHFNVFQGKGLDRLWVGDYENRAIRPHALGRFRDLLEATARHPAMLFYLDNWQNSAPGSPAPKGRESGLNENYARELMELHTLGVDGGYTQNDVIALARILTGWGLARPRRPREIQISDDGFVFAADRHDYGTKLFLGRTVAGSGADEVERALDTLAASPATARHISWELAQYFVADTPPPALVDRLAKRWMETGGDIRAVLAALFASPEFRDPADYGAKFKTPYQYVISSVRAAGIPVANFRLLLGAMHRLGEPLYGCLTPDGYKNTRDAWLNPDAMAIRISFATALGSGHMKLAEAPDRDDDADAGPPPADAAPTRSPPLDSGLLMGILEPELGQKTRDAVAQAGPGLKAALILGSPEFQNR